MSLSMFTNLKKKKITCNFFRKYFSFFSLLLLFFTLYTKKPNLLMRFGFKISCRYFLLEER